MTPPTVLYILGAARSGSTLLATLLGQVDGFLNAGELRTVWGRTSAHCQCGRPLAGCPIWGQALAALTADGLPPDPGPAVQAAQARSTRLRHLPGLMVWAWLRRPPSPSAARYARWLARVYTAAAWAAGARVVVDASKSAAEAVLLASTTDLPVHVVQLVRDPRDVVHSWSSRPQKKSVGGATANRVPRALTAANWTLVNLSCEVARTGLPPGRFERVRYEDFAAEPGPSVARLCRALGIEGAPGLAVSGAHVDLRPGHSVGGGATVQKTGVVGVQAVSGGQEGLSRRDLALTWALTRPLAGRYGYRRRRAC